MVVDSSAVFAVALEEADALAIVERLLRATRPLISTATLIEITAVATRRFRRQLDARIDHILTSIDYEAVAVSRTQALIGQQCYRRFGQGSGHPAKLNFGDCFAYALAKERGEPLLFKGDDFIHTDVTPAL